MYEEKPKKSLSLSNLNINWKSLLIKLAILLVAVFIILFLVSLVKKDKKTLESNLATNLQSMKTAAKEYFVGSRLPSNVNGRKKITLGEMFDNHLITKFTDQNNNTCDTIGSYAEATKINSTDYTIKVKLVCGEESDYVIDTIKVEDQKLDVPVDNNGNINQDSNQNNNNSNNSNNNTNNVVNKPNNSGTTNTKPNNSTNNSSINKPNSSTNNVVANNTCTYGNKDYISIYPLAYIIPGNCAVSNNDFYKAEYANKVSSLSASEYIKLNNEAVALKNKTGVNVYTEVPAYYGIYNKSGKGLVGYQVLFTMKQKVNYVTTTVYQYYLDSNGNRSVVIDKRNSIGNNTGNNNNNNSSKPSTSVVRVSSVSLNKSSVYLDVDDTYYLYATVTPNNATYKNVTWKSSNTNVATVNSNGKVTALRRGTTTITATVDGKSASATIYVDDNIISVSKITLNKTYLDLDINETYKLIATVTPNNATYKNVTWKSSNTSIATVNSKGEVTARRGGRVTITATADGVSASATIYVNSVIPVSNIVINKSYLELGLGDTYILTATVYPSNATNKNVSWSSSNTLVATVSSSGKVTAKRPGSTLIRATADGFTTSIWVYVNDNSNTESYCKQKTQTDYFINVEEKNKYSNNSYTLEYYDKKMKNATVINAGYVYDSQYDDIRSYFNNPRVTMVASYDYLDRLPYNYQTSALKRENFGHNITQTYQKNGRWYIDISYTVDNYNNVYSRWSSFSGKNIYYVPLFFQIEYIDLDDCISAREYNALNQPREYKEI